MAREKVIDYSDFVIPYLSLQHNRLLMYSLPAFEYSRKGHNILHLTSPEKLKAYTSGMLTAGAAKRLKQALELLVDLSPVQKFTRPSDMKQFNFRLTFATFTLPSPQAEITDTQIVKECLAPMLQIMRRRWGMKHYVWRAEKQKNGNIHFHVTTNRYIPYDQMRDEWNRCLNKLDFIDRFEKKHNHRHPNSTDIHSVRKVRDIAAYMVKYMSKEVPENLRVSCKQWDCSKNLKGVKRPTFEIDTEIWNNLQELFEQTDLRHITGDRYWIVKEKGKDIRERLSEGLQIANKEFIESLR